MYDTRNGKKCVIYIRVSSERQVKGYSLDGQQRYLSEWAERQGMTVSQVYVEEGKSGKSIEGRTEFQKMLDDIATGATSLDYVIVFKLSRFGRNAKDILNSLEFLQRYQVHLLCVEDGLDSSNAMGKMMITILGAVAEMERENIIEQSFLGRREKALSGGWNGGFAPYGYRLADGKLVADETEKEIVKMIFQKFLHENMGYTAISSFLNRNGYKRPPAKNAVRPSYGEWSSDQIKKLLANPVYTGRIAYAKRRSEKVEGTENDYRLVPQKEFIMSTTISHEAFITEAEYQQVQEIKAMKAKRGNHNIGQAHAHLLSGIVRCPQCGAAMYIGVTRWQNEDGTKMCRESYVCSYATKHRGTSVCKRNGVSAELVEKEVMEVTKKLVKNPRLAEDLERKISSSIDFSEVEREVSYLKEQISKLKRSRNNLERDIDGIGEDDEYSSRLRDDMNRRLKDIYAEIYKAEDSLAEAETKRNALQQEQLSVKTIYTLLSSFDKIYDKMSQEERRAMIKYMISDVQLYMPEERKEKGRYCKSITYRFPIEPTVLSRFSDKEAHVETVCLLTRADP